MDSIFFVYFLLFFGLFCLFFGTSLLFQKGFVEWLQQGLWKNDPKIFSEKDEYIYNKFVRGIGTLLFGLLSTGFAVYWLLSIYGYL